MSAVNQTNTGRRSFFLRGGAVLGAGLASASAGADTLLFDQSLPLKEQLAQMHLQLNAMEDKEAIRQLQLAYAALLENKAYEAVLELFTDDASIELHGGNFVGKEKGIRQLFTEAYPENKSSELHTGFRQNQTQQQDLVNVNQDLVSATATYYLDVEISKPQTDTSVLGEMARLQNQGLSREWKSGKFDVAYRKVKGQWKISKLAYT